MKYQMPDQGRREGGSGGSEWKMIAVDSGEVISLQISVAIFGHVLFQCCYKIDRWQDIFFPYYIM